jgi:uncharacterized protein
MVPAMKFAEIGSGDGHRIEGYAPGRIIIDGRGYSEGLMLSPERIITGWGPAQAADLSGEHLAGLIALAPQVIVIGTGDRQVFPNPGVLQIALAQGLGVEIMDTGAACRTYNLLMAEGRKVAAGLMVG